MNYLWIGGYHPWDGWIFCGFINAINWWMGGWVDGWIFHFDGYHPLDGCVPCGLVNAIHWWMGGLVFSY